MKTVEAAARIADIASGQWGLVTSAQALDAGVSRHDLVRLVGVRLVERVAHGVYRDSGSAPSPVDGIRAAWLSSMPGILAEDRLDLRPEKTVAVGGATAAFLHGFGDLNPEPITLISPVRRQTQRTDLRYVREDVERRDITLVDGLPTTRVERTIADLVRDRRDLSLVSDVLADALRSDLNVDMERLAEVLAPLARRNEFSPGDGAGLLDKLLAISGLDTASLLREIVAGPAQMALASQLLEDLGHKLSELVQREDIVSMVGMEMSGDAYEAFRRVVRVSQEQVEALTAFQQLVMAGRQKTAVAEFAAWAQQAVQVIEMTSSGFEAAQGREAHRAVGVKQ